MKKFIKSFIKTHTHLKDEYDFKMLDLEKRLIQDNGIPKVDLAEKHISGLKVLTNRIALLQMMPLNAVCAEIGVNRGEFSEEIIKITHPSKMHLIDAWGDTKRYHDGLKLDVEEKFSKQIAEGLIEINVGFSNHVLETFPDHYFDWVYLDTDHTYKQTKTELDVLLRKMKMNGIIAGHDYIMGNWPGNVRYGVIESVHEFCVQYNWQLKYITINYAESPSFAIQKITPTTE
ncbi:MAG: class I SAM-dependent methyltransferase [Ferruginibacter sp.]|nr:class I SAM-dependent methyltransferase [Ferruginibacter sp.]